jgi:hypothetical protein
MRKIFLAASLFCVSVAAQAAGQPLTNDDIIGMVDLGDELILETIKHSPTEFDVAPDALRTLKQANVSIDVIRAMLAAKRQADVASADDAPATPLRTAEFALVDPEGNENPLFPARVTMEISKRKKFIPVVGSQMPNEMFYFFKGATAGNAVGSDAQAVTRLQPTRLRLVHLDLHRRGDRFVVFQRGSSDRELPISVEDLGDGYYAVRARAALPPGQYAYLVSPEPTTGDPMQALLAQAIAQSQGTERHTTGYEFSVR